MGLQSRAVPACCACHGRFARVPFEWSGDHRGPAYPGSEPHGPADARARLRLSRRDDLGLGQTHCPRRAHARRPPAWAGRPNHRCRYPAKQALLDRTSPSPARDQNTCAGTLRSPSGPGVACTPSQPLSSRARRLSERQLDRRFRDANRVSPKRFASLLRFERALPQLDGGRSLARIAVDAVYADQSHFSREIARFSGLSPARLRQQRRRSFAQLDMSGSFKIK
jgi:AraC-like DNA-binding protein